MLKQNSTYKAVIKVDGKVKYELRGRSGPPTFTKSELDAFVAQYWPYDLKYHAVGEGESCLELIVWRYRGNANKMKITHAQSGGFL